jgi:hypothetical protein
MEFGFNQLRIICVWKFNGERTLQIVVDAENPMNGNGRRAEMLLGEHVARETQSQELSRDDAGQDPGKKRI